MAGRCGCARSTTGLTCCVAWPPPSPIGVAVAGRAPAWRDALPGANRRLARHHKIDYAAEKIDALLCALFIESHSQASGKIVLDLDATITGSAGSLAAGNTYICTMTPSSGSAIASVSGYGGSGTSSYTGSMSGSVCTVTAIFDVLPGSTYQSISMQGVTKRWGEIHRPISCETLSCWRSFSRSFMSGCSSRK